MFECADFLSYSPRNFDLLLCVDVFEHVEDYLGFLKNLHGHSKEYIFHIPLDMHVSGMLRDAEITARATLGHLHYFSKATALATLVDANFEIQDWCFTRGAEELAKVHPERGFKTILGNGVRRLLRGALGDAMAAKLMGGYSLLVLAHSRQ